VEQSPSRAESRTKRVRDASQDPELTAAYAEYQAAVFDASVSPIPFKEFVEHRRTFVFHEDSMFSGMLDDYTLT